MKATRRELDAYYSALWMPHFLLKHIAIEHGSLILEPCVGSGVISRYLSARGHYVVTADIDPAIDANFTVDYLKNHDIAVGHFDWIITNPPYNQAFEMLQKAIAEARVGVAFLLRLSFMEPTEERGEWLEKNPPTGRITLPRYSFTNNGKTDSVTSEWMIWLKDKSVPQFSCVVSKTTVRNWCLTQSTIVL